MSSGIYKLVMTNGAFYVGSSMKIERRFKNHLSQLCGNRHGNVHLQRSFNKFGLLECSTLELCEEAVLIEREQFYIDTLKPTLNLSPTAGRSTMSDDGKRRLSEKTRKRRIGSKMSLETKRKISLSKIGKPRPDVSARQTGKLGKKMSPETRAKISASLLGNERTLGIKRPKEAVLKHATFLRGNKYALGLVHSKEARRKMSAALIGNKRRLGLLHSEETKAKMRAKFTPERRATLAAARRQRKGVPGMKHTEETKLKMKLAWKKRKENLCA